MFDDSEVGAVMQELSTYMAGALRTAVRDDVMEKAKHHVLDTLAAMVSGSWLKPGKFAISYIEKQGGVKEATVVGSSITTTAVNAALANGMLAHADETDDSHAPSITHPGCAVVPAALAAAEKYGRSGEEWLRAVILGYDIGCRTTRALNPQYLSRTFRSSHTIGGQFGAAAAAGAMADLDARGFRHLLSYAVQQASGVRCWVRDVEHVQKAFVFGGKPAQDGVLAATMVADGFTGVEDAFSGERNFFETFSPESDPELMVWDLGEHYEVSVTNIKKWPVGSPIQAAVDCILQLRQEHGLEASDVEHVLVKLPSIKTVNDRKMPDINLQYIVATTLLDGHLTFETSQNYERMNDPEVVKMRERVSLVKGEELQNVTPRRQAIAEITTRDGRCVSTRVRAVRGTAENPMTRDEVITKATELMVPVLGQNRTTQLVEAILDAQNLGEVSDLRPLLRV